MQEIKGEVLYSELLQHLSIALGKRSERRTISNAKVQQELTLLSEMKKQLFQPESN